MEGGLQKPTRFSIDWKNKDYLNEELFEKELRRVSDHCHGCRRCVSLCNSFPTLFDLIDEFYLTRIYGNYNCDKKINIENIKNNMKLHKKIKIDNSCHFEIWKR